MRRARFKGKGKKFEEIKKKVENLGDKIKERLKDKKGNKKVGA